ncbi:MAG TPA: hypothetical protein DEB33_09010 [Gemmatimonadetes bacterium]|nr:hypothetical protein [Gemmatimonadota bacterium]
MINLADPLKDAFQSSTQHVSTRSSETLSARQYAWAFDLLEEARLLDLTVKDARHLGGQIRVLFSGRSGASVLSIARKLKTARLALHLGNTNVK